jgi:uncharacterized membrane protein
MGLINPMSRRAGPEDGALGILAALALALIIGLGAFSADLGLVYYRQRALQAAVDMAALAAARAPDRANEFIASALESQGIEAATASASIGHYQERTDLISSERFQPGSSSDGAPAVLVTAETDVPLGLARIFGVSTIRVGARATAVYQPVAGFTLGSGTASLGPGGVNSLLGGLLGGNLSLTAADYTGLAHAQIDALKFLDALAVSTGLSAGTYDQLLETTLSARAILDAAVSALGSGSDAAASSALIQIAAAASPSGSIGLGKLLDLGFARDRTIGSMATGPYATLSANAFDLVSAVASLGGTTAAAVPVSLNIPVVGSVTAYVKLAEPPVAAPAPPAEGRAVLGPVGIRASTAQVRVLIEITLLDTGIGLSGVTVPLLVTVAEGAGMLQSITCGNNPATDTEVAITATTGLARAQIGAATMGTLGAPTVPATLPPAEVNGVPVLGQIFDFHLRADAQVGSVTQDLAFSAQQIGRREPQTIQASGIISTLGTTLAKSLTVTPVLLGAEVPVTPLTSLVTSALVKGLTPVLERLDTALDALLAAVGVKLGTLQVTPTGARCGAPGLVT